MEKQWLSRSQNRASFVVCNLASLSLGHLNVEDGEEIADITKCAVRALDNVIDLNFFPVPYAKINNEKYRPIGLGVSGYHHMLAKQGISWESEQHLQFVGDVFSKIHYAAIEASSEIAKEREVTHILREAIGRQENILINDI